MACFVIVVGGIIGTVGLLAYVAKDLPSPDKIVRREGFATKIYDRNGKLLYDVFTDQRRTPIDINQVPPQLRQATIAIEDKSFYQHSGFDLLTPFRIAYNLVFKRRVVGGSTLSQQLVKKRLLSDERTLSRKIKEFVLTLQVEAKYDKDQILQMYLNEVPYGGTAYGVEVAAETFFGKPVAQVSLTEAAILAGLPQSPTRYSPFAGKLYENRTREVLRRMREDGYITSEEEKKSLEELPNIKIAEDKGFLKAPHFIFYVRRELEERFGENIVDQGGLQVTTTLDADLQDEAEKIVAEEINKVKHLKISNGGTVVADVNNGQILAMVGSRGWDDPEVDGKFNVTTAPRQPGSAIKPVTYLTGLRKGYTAATLLMDTKTAFPGGDKPEYNPENYDLKFRGPVLVREALGNSLNIPAVKMLSLVGIKDMLQTGYDMGLTTLEPTPDFLSKVGLAVTLGGGEVRLLDMVTAYSAFANGGKRIEPVAILKVTDNQGKVLEEWKDSSHREVVGRDEAFIISSILSDPAARSITFGAATS
ncbi:MAG: transglycosylase domain-containing protein, partial [candidate division Zixibacteria bacterium]|nr:transglycosylase domain-containing protein [candidate division Zixibacteria bacterium]